MGHAEDILFVLNELKPISLDSLKFTVITDAPDERERGFWPFRKGEIIINTGGGDREPFGEGRKPAKWDVAVDSFDTLEEALECRRKVLTGKWPRRYAHKFTRQRGASTCRACGYAADDGIHLERVDGQWVPISHTNAQRGDKR